MYSLKQRLHRNLLIIVAIFMVVLITIFHYGIKYLTSEFVSSRIQHDIDSLVTALQQASDGRWVIPRERMSTVYNRIHSGHYYFVLVNDQTIRSRSLFDLDNIPSAKDAAKNNCYLKDVQSSYEWMICKRVVVKQGSHFSIWVAEDVSQMVKDRLSFLFLSMVAVIFAIGALVLMQYVILQRGFKQLDHLREAIRSMQVGADDISLQKLPLETLPLVNEIDRLLKQLENRINRSRNALGNLAHELKRPLQNLRSQIEKQGEECRADSISILNDVNTIVERELKRARIVGVTTPGRQFILSEDIPQLIKVMHSIYPDKKVEADYATKQILPHDRDDLLELLGNLLDNACKHAHKNIWMQIKDTGEGYELVVEDDGSGITQSAMSSITDRGVRLDESVSGHGLGLSICKDIVDSYGGSITFGAAKEGGLSVKIVFPKTQRIAI